MLINLSLEAAAARGRFSLALAGGATPRRAYELLSQPPFSDQAPWNRIHVFWGDERCVPPEDPRNNARMARQAFLDTVPLPSGQIHPILCHGHPNEGANRYEALLKAFFRQAAPRFDLVLLGLGANGHTASLFPYAPVLKKDQRWAAPVYVEEEDLYRVTLTPDILNQARHAAFLVSGRAKAKVVREVLKGPYEPERLPAQLIRPEPGELIWLVDKEAAAGLDKE